MYVVYVNEFRLLRFIFLFLKVYFQSSFFFSFVFSFGGGFIYVLLLHPHIFEHNFYI